MHVIAKISCYLERGVVTQKLRKEYLNSVTHTTSVLLRIKYWTVWCIERYSMSTYTGVTNCQKTVRFFWPTLYIIGNALATTKVSYIVSKGHELWSTNGFKLDLHFYPPDVNSAFYYIARLRRRRPEKRTKLNFAKRWTVNRDNNVP